MYQIQISSDEILDRSLILQLKARLMQNPEKRTIAQQQLDALRKAGEPLYRKLSQDPVLQRLADDLYACHQHLWDTEEFLRQVEAANGPFDEKFVTAARNVYKLNDRRHELRTLIAKHLGEAGEVKEYLIKKSV